MNPTDNIFDLTKPYFFKRGPIGVMLVHGFTSSPNDLRILGEYLAERNLSVYGVRLQGHGVHHEVLKKTSRFDWFYSLKRAADILKKEVKKVFLVGFSMGGNLSLLFSELEEGVKGLILVNTPIYTKEKRYIFWFIPLIKRFKKFKTKEWVKNMDHYFEMRDHGSYFRTPLGSAWQFYKLVQDSKKVLPHIFIPVYIIQSTKDERINPESADFLIRKIGSQDKRIDYIETDKHQIFANFSKKEEIFEKIYNFIKEKSN